MKKSLIVAFVIFLAVIAWFLSGQVLNDKKNNKELTENNIKNKKLIDSSLAKVESKIIFSEEISQSIKLQGQTTHNKIIDVKSETTGIITKKDFKRGDSVNSSDILLELSIEDRMELLESYEKELELYKIEYESTKKLSEKGLSSKSKISKALLNLTTAESKIKKIKIDIDNTKIKSPFSGIVNNSYVEKGDFVQPGSKLFSVVDLNPIKIQGFLSENDVNKVTVGTKAEINSSNSIKKMGKITFISPSADTSTRTFEITIEANNDDLLFKSGITASILIKVGNINAHKIPPSILSLKDDGTVGIKAINKKNEVVFYPIKEEIDTIDGMWVSGLPKEIRIIISGQEYITVGQTVEFQ